MRGARDRLALQGARWSGEVLVIADVAPASHFAIRAAILVRAQTAFSPLTNRAVLCDGLTSGLEVDAVLQVVQQCEVLERDQCGDVPSSTFEAESDALCRGRFAAWTRCRVLRNIPQARVLLACECSGAILIEFLIRGANPFVLRRARRPRSAALVCDGERRELSGSGPSSATAENRPVELPAANLDEVVKTMDLWEVIVAIPRAFRWIKHT